MGNREAKQSGGRDGTGVGRRRLLLCAPRAFAFLAAGALFLSFSRAEGLAAQTVRGQVVDGASQQPIPGAFIILLDASGTRRAAVLSGATGAFILRAPEGGKYTLHAERIGYQPAVSGTLEIVAGQTLAYRFEISVRPVDLEGLQVTGKGRCRMSRESGVETTVLWEEIRKALSIAVLGDTERGVPFQTAVWSRTRRVTSLEILEDTLRLKSGYGRTPFVSESASRLGTLGFVRAQDDGSYVFYGLDAKTLLSEDFLTYHCFRVVKGGRSQEGLIGLAFQPVFRNGPPDIEGTLWVDRATAELRYLEFRFNELLMSGALPLEFFGGRTDFLRLPNGDWVVSHWWLRMPKSRGDVVALDPPDPLANVPLTESDIRRTAEWGGLQIHEEGGKIRFIGSPGGGSTEGGADITGMVYDSTRWLPLEGANVFLTDVNVATTTDSLGRFRLTRVPTGPHMIAFTHPRTDFLDLPVSPLSIDVSPGRPTSVSLSVPAGAACPPDTASGAVVGFVVDMATGEPIPDLVVNAAWWVPGVEKPSPTQDRIEKRTLLADSHGRYLLCGASLHEEVDLRAEDGPMAPGPMAQLHLGVPGTVHHNLLLRRGGN